MAKKKIKFSGPSTAQIAKQDEEFQVRDDADKIKRYAELTRDQKRHSAALDHIGNEHRAIMSLAGNPSSNENSSSPKMLSRQGRKKSVRVPRKTGRR